MLGSEISYTSFSFMSEMYGVVVRSAEALNIFKWMFDPLLILVAPHGHWGENGSLLVPKIDATYVEGQCFNTYEFYLPFGIHVLLNFWQFFKPTKNKDFSYNNCIKSIGAQPSQEGEQIGALDHRLHVEVSHPVESLIHDKVHKADAVACKPFACPQKLFKLLEFLRQSIEIFYLLLLLKL